ncbi:MAG: ABC transporter permease [Dechloromonas sp.]|nr:MAG: ABC transporter permease [Dechloromonas sp.]
MLAYLVAVIGIGFVHQPLILALALAGALLAAGSLRWRLLRRAVLALLLFNAGVSLAYVIVAGWQGKAVLDALLLINLRVLLLVFLGFWLVERGKPLAALAGWPLLSMIATLAVGQIAVYRRLLDDFRLAFRSRNPLPPRPATLLRHAGAQGSALLDKSLQSAEQTAQAMRSRGAFDV